MDESLIAQIEDPMELLLKVERDFQFHKSKLEDYFKGKESFDKTEVALALIENEELPDEIRTHLVEYCTMKEASQQLIKEAIRRNPYVIN